MLQELITFLIVGLAVVIALRKMYKRFSKKKVKSADFKKAKLAESHNCSDCSASGCALRDAPRKIIDKSAELCDTNYTAK